MPGKDASMLGDETKNDKNFTPENYEEFYAHHYFRPLDEEVALNIDNYLPRFKWAMDKVRDLHPGSLLDIGCLDGAFVLSVRHGALAERVVGIDLSVDGIAVAKERADHRSLDVTFEQGSAEKLLQSYAKQKVTFDLITFFEVIEHVEDVPKLLKLVDKVLAPGGSVLISTPQFEGPHYGLDDEQNTCHVRLYTMEDEDYQKVNKHGTLRQATSITNEIGKSRIQEMTLVGDQICIHYK